MERIELPAVVSMVDFDHGEGWISFSRVNSVKLDRYFTMDIDGHCSREMPVRSGTGVSIVDLQNDCVRLCLTDALAAKLELESEVEFTGQIPGDVATDLRRLAEL
ncbi:hypothetical protein OAG51_01495 [Pirellulaceae bacterium]|jgi:hypothetical protein|nr:hypothetical protein [Pirellulaceae bacterium]